jgi:predicted TIM-barrel fold metal-dependent hydrolase
VLESGGGWIGYWLDRIDAVYGHTFIGQRVPLEHKPSDYFRDRVWISCDPDERTIPALVARFGDRFMWASDFPHADHTPEYVLDLDELAASFSEDGRAAFLGQNARDLFRIGM